MNMEFLASKYEIIPVQMGENCNPDDKIVIENFRGYLTFIYAQKTPAIQDMSDRLLPMTDDFGGFSPMFTVRSEKWSKAELITLRPNQELALLHSIGDTLTLEYAPVDHALAIVVQSSSAGFSRHAG